MVFSPSVAVRDAPWGRKVGTKAQGDVVRTDMRSVGNDRKGGGWVRLEGGYEGGEGWMLLHGAALGLGTLLEARRPYCPTYLLHISLTSPPHLPHISPTSPLRRPYISLEAAEPAEPAGSSSAAPALLFLCTGEGEHSADSDVAYLRASPSWLDVQAMAELPISPLRLAARSRLHLPYISRVSPLYRRPWRSSPRSRRSRPSSTRRSASTATRLGPCSP